MVEALRKIGSSADGLKFATALVFVRGLAAQMLLNALDDEQILARPLTRDGMQEVLSSMASRHCRAVEAVASKNSGAGNTFEILRQVKQLQDEVDASVPHYVAIRETTSVGHLVEAFKSDKTDPDTPTAAHLNLAHIFPVPADIWLLIVKLCGVLPVANVYHRRRPHHLYIEVSNSPRERTASCPSLSVLCCQSAFSAWKLRGTWLR